MPSEPPLLPSRQPTTTNHSGHAFQSRELSLAKALGIIAVVVGHCNGAPQFPPFLAYSFHMPLFFFLAGLSYRSKNDYGAYIGSKGRSLLVPYFLYNVAFALTTPLIFQWTGIRYGSNVDIWWRPEIFFLQPFLLGDQYQLYLAAWFACSLFIIHCLYRFLQPRLKSLPVLAQLAIFAALAVSGMAYGRVATTEPASHALNLVFFRNLFGLFFFALGHQAATWNKWDKILTLPHLVAVIALQTILFTFFRDGIAFGVVGNKFPSLWLPFVTSICGIFLVLFTARALARMGEHGSTGGLIALGNASFHIMALHLAIFHLLNMAFLLRHHQDLLILGQNFWFIHRPEQWWWLYCGCALVLPTLGHWVYQKLFPAKARSRQSAYAAG